MSEHCVHRCLILRVIDHLAAGGGLCDPAPAPRPGTHETTGPSAPGTRFATSGGGDGASAYHEEQHMDEPQNAQEQITAERLKKVTVATTHTDTRLVRLDGEEGWLVCTAIEFFVPVEVTERSAVATILALAKNTEVFR